MIFGAVVAIVSAWLLGVLSVAAMWPARPLRRSEILLILALGMGVGLGVTSALFFAASLAPSRTAAMYTLEFLVGVSAAWLAWSRRRPLSGRTDAPASNDRLGSLIVGTVFTQACLVAAAVGVRAYGAEPFSSSDGWTIWNMHARILYLGGENWPEILRATQLGWTHPDYPLLVPASVARAWTYAGHDSPVVAGAISGMFGLATLALLVAGVSYLRSRTVALIGGLVLLGTPFFVTFSTNEHADIPLSFYILATLVLTAATRNDPGAWRTSALAGICAGFAAWTKNEGLLFAVVVSAVFMAYGLAAGARGRIAAFVAGIAVALIPVACFKLSIAPPNDVVASDPWTRLNAMLDWSRHRLIIQSLWRDVSRFGEWSTVPFLAMVLPLIGSGWRQLSPREWIIAVVLGLVLAGYYIVYLLTHMDLAFHLDSSLVRLLLQLWPGAVFFWCLAISCDASHPLLASRAMPGTQARNPGMFIAVNGALAAVVFSALGRQLPVDQFGANRIDGATAALFAGDGWFGMERHGTDRWAWSTGKSTLHIDVNSKPPQSVTLQFSIRALGSRMVTARMGEKIIWQASVGEDAQDAEVRGLAIKRGTTHIVFQTDSPGVPESNGANARELTFALYNPVITSH
jgi:hypothetical protein